MLNAADFQFELPDPFEENVLQMRQLWKEHPESWPFIPRKYCYDDYDRLQGWVQINRKRYLDGKLSVQQIKLLKTINFPLETRITKWERDVSNFRDFVEKYNRYPERTKDDYKENKLAEWRLHKMRLFNEGLLSKEKLKVLKSIRPALLKTALVKKNSWDLKYDKLKELWEQETQLRGKIPVPKCHTEYKMWYNWFNINKMRFKNRFLSAEKGSLLEKIGFDFSQSSYAQKCS